MREPASDHSTEDTGPVLVDVASMPLAALLAADDTVLSNTLRRLLRAKDHDHDVTTSFDSGLP
jgi:FXSXX-COOH protein